MVLATASATSPAADRRWENGFPDRPDFFPVGVWLQSPRNAERYKSIGINTYVALWRGPTEEQLATLEKAGMHVICGQSESALKFKDRKVIVGWMHGDEPDNAQPVKGPNHWGPPIAPDKIVADYERIKMADPTRPVLLNLGQGVAWDNWRGRGVRSRHPEDYAQYLKGCDIASFDIYPVTHESPEVSGKLWYVGYGVKRLLDWSGGAKPAWACIETTHISNEKAMPTPDQVRSEVWMAIANGASGIIYFCHEFKPQQIEAGLLSRPEIVEAVGSINADVTRLAPVIHSPTVPGGVQVRSGESAAGDDPPAAVLCKRQAGDTWVIAVSRRAQPARLTFTLLQRPKGGKAEVDGENRSIPIERGTFGDDFGAYGVHIYRVSP